MVLLKKNRDLEDRCSNNAKELLTTQRSFEALKARAIPIYLLLVGRLKCPKVTLPMHSGLDSLHEMVGTDLIPVRS